MDQALPNQFPQDLGTLFQQMPAIAAGQVGNQQRIAQQNNASLQNAFQREQGFLDQKRPLDLETIVSQNRGRDAQTEQLTLENAFKKETQPAKIEAENATNKGKVSLAELQELDNMGQLFGQVSARMATAPPPMRAAIAKRLLEKYIPENPEFDNLLVSNADALPQYFKDMADNVFKMSRAARMEQMREDRELSKEEARFKREERIAQINAGGKVDAAKARSDAAAKTASEAEMVAKMGFEKAAVYYDAKASEAEQAGNTDRAEMYRAKSDTMKMAFERAKILSAMQGQAGRVDIGQETGMATRPEPQPQGFGGKGALPPGLPQGTKANGDGTFTLPDGRVIRKKQ